MQLCYQRSVSTAFAALARAGHSPCWEEMCLIRTAQHRLQSEFCYLDMQ